MKSPKISWNKNIEPGPSILKHHNYLSEIEVQAGFKNRKVQEKKDSSEYITKKLDKIGQSIEKITEILMRNDLVDTPLVENEVKDDKKISKDDTYCVRERNYAVGQSHEERRKSLNVESEQRSASFQDLRDRYQKEDQAKKEKVIVVIAQNKDKKNISSKNIGEKVKPKKAIARKNEEIERDMKTELKNKLNSKRSIDKPSSKFLYIGRRKNRQKVVPFDFCFIEMLMYTRFCQNHLQKIILR